MPGPPPTAIPDRLTVADVGARGGFALLPALRPRLILHAFEPDAGACATLRAMDGLAEVHVTPAALAESVGEAWLHVTRHPALSSLRAPDVSVYAAVFGVGVDGSGPFEVVGRQRVPTTTLDAWSTAAGVAHVDFLKLDTQGTEAEVLRGADVLLATARVGVVQAEVSFWPLYTGQAVFSDVDHQLRAHGYDLVDVRFTPESAPPGTRWNAIADATWCCPPVRWPPGRVNRHVAASALVLAQLGYGSTAAALLTGHDGWSPDGIDRFLDDWGRPTQAERRRARWRQWVPPRLLDIVRGRRHAWSQA